MSDENGWIAVYPAEHPNTDPRLWRRVRVADLERFATTGDKNGTLWLPVEQQAEPTPQTPVPSRTEAAWEGAKQGATFGFRDELAGVAAGLGALAGGDDVDPAYRKTFGEAYREGRDEDRAETERVKAARPNAFLAGEVGGAIGTAPVLPGAALKGATRLAKLGKAAVVGAGYGATAGAGNAAEIADVPANATLGAVTGAPLGAAGAVGQEIASRAARPVFRRVSEALADSSKAMQERADTARVLTLTGGTGGAREIMQDVRRVPGAVSEMAQTMRETPGLSGAFRSTRSVLKNADAANEEANAVIRAVIEGVDDQGTRVDTERFAAKLQAKALEYMDGERDAVADALFEKAATYRERYPNGVTMAEAQKLVRVMSDPTSWVKEAGGQALPARKQAGIDATRLMREEMDSAADQAFKGRDLPVEANTSKRVFPKGMPEDALEAYKRARRISQVTKIAEDSAQRSVDKMTQNNALGLGTTSKGAVAGQVAGPAGAVAGMAVDLATKGGRGLALRASTAEAAARMVKALSNPRVAERLGATGAALLQASGRGPEALVAEYVAQRLINPDVGELEGILMMHTPEEKKPSVDAGLAPLLR